MRSRIAAVAAAATLLALAAFAAAARPWGKPGPGRYHAGTAAHHSQRTGYGVIRFDGAGAEKWRWRWLLEHRRALKAERRLRNRFSRDVAYALRLASAAYGVPYSQLSAVAWCESNHDPSAVNGQYRGLFQEGPMFERGPFAGFSPWDPVPNALMAAYTVSREGWQQWECRPR